VIQHTVCPLSTQRLQCIATGRPPIIYDPLLIDCTFPLDMDTEHEPGGPKLAPESNSFMRTRDLVSRVVVLTTVIEPPQYRDILALDATIRAEWTPPSKQSRLGAEISMLRRAIFVGPYRALGGRFWCPILITGHSHWF
jgi:hypothetical protein